MNKKDLDFLVTWLEAGSYYQAGPGTVRLQVVVSKAMAAQIKAIADFNDTPNLTMAGFLLNLGVHKYVKDLRVTNLFENSEVYDEKFEDLEDADGNPPTENFIKEDEVPF